METRRVLILEARDLVLVYRETCAKPIKGLTARSQTIVAIWYKNPCYTPNQSTNYYHLILLTALRISTMEDLSEYEQIL